MGADGPVLAIALSSEALWWANLLVLTAVYALLAMSLHLVNGWGGMFSLGHHGFWAIGAYGAAWLTVRLAGDLPGGIVFALSALFGMLAAALGGALIGIPCLRLRGDYLAIATLGFGEIVRKAIENSPEEMLGGSIGYRIPRVLMEVRAKTRADFRLLCVGLGVLLVAAVALALRNMMRSSRGRAIRAVAQDETAAALLGIDPTRPKVTAFLVGSGIAGLAGALYAHYQGRIAPLEFSFMETVKVFLIVVLGTTTIRRLRVGTLASCILAAFVLITAEQLLARTGGWIYEWQQVFYALLLILLVGGRDMAEAVLRWVRVRATS